MRLHDFSTLSVECYGTPIDWESGILTALRGDAAADASQPDCAAPFHALAAIRSVFRDTPPAAASGIRICRIGGRRDGSGSGANPVVNGKVRPDLEFGGRAATVRQNRGATGA